MYANIFTDLHFAEILKRLENLQAASVRKWGTMSAAQMLRHCRSQIEFILDPKDDVKVYKTMFRFAPVRWFALYGIPWPKNAATAPEMDVTKKLTDTADFDHEKEKILHALKNLYQAEGVQATHPLFGSMGKDKWGRVIWKHLDHHLRQFGC
jgi:hypothetical protein